jgi:hypothetical protein
MEGALDDLLDDLVFDDGDMEDIPSKSKKAPMSEEEKAEKRRLHFQKARKRAKANKRAKGVKRDYTWKDEPLESISFARPVVVIDLSFAERMRAKEVVSVANQVQQCYGRNRKAAAAQNAAKTEEERQKVPPPVELHLLGLQQPALAPVFAKHEGFDKWKLFKHDSCILTDVFDAKRIVVLSPESQNLLQEIDKEAIYVIGGWKRACGEVLIFFFFFFFFPLKKNQKGISDNQNDMKVLFVVLFWSLERFNSSLLGNDALVRVQAWTVSCATSSARKLSRWSIIFPPCFVLFFFCD